MATVAWVEVAALYFGLDFELEEKYGVGTAAKAVTVAVAEAAVRTESSCSSAGVVHALPNGAKTENGSVSNWGWVAERDASDPSRQPHDHWHRVMSPSCA